MQIKKINLFIKLIFRKSDINLSLYFYKNIYNFIKIDDNNKKLTRETLKYKNR